jgi:hypothetical protein
MLAAEAEDEGARTTQGTRPYRNNTIIILKFTQTKRQF